MTIDVLMPALSPTMTEGVLSKWLVATGDQVQSGDVIAEIETDKAVMEVEAVDEGVVGKILVEAGTENVAVNAPIMILLEEGARRRNRFDCGFDCACNLPLMMRKNRKSCIRHSPCECTTVAKPCIGRGTIHGT